MLLPSDDPMLAATSLAALTSIELGMKMPSCPSLSKTASSTGMIVPRYSNEVMSMPSRSPCTRAAPTMTVLRGMRTPATCIGSVRRKRTDCPSVTVWLPCTHAGMVLRPTAVEVPTAVWNPKFRSSVCAVMNSLSVMGCASEETMRSATCPTGCATALPLRTVFLSSSVSAADGCCVVPPCPAGIYLAANS